MMPEYDILPPPPKIKSVGEAVLALRDVQEFLEDRSEFELSSNLIDKIAIFNISKSKQTTIDTFLCLSVLEPHNCLKSIHCYFFMINSSNLSLIKTSE